MTIEVAVEFLQQTAVDKTDQLYYSPVETLPSTMCCCTTANKKDRQTQLRQRRNPPWTVWVFRAIGEARKLRGGPVFNEFGHGYDDVIDAICNFYPNSFPPFFSLSLFRYRLF